MESTFRTQCRHQQLQEGSLDAMLLSSDITLGLLFLGLTIFSCSKKNGNLSYSYPHMQQLTPCPTGVDTPQPSSKWTNAYSWGDRASLYPLQDPSCSWCPRCSLLGSREQDYDHKVTANFSRHFIQPVCILHTVLYVTTFLFPALRILQLAASGCYSHSALIKWVWHFSAAFTLPYLTPAEKQKPADSLSTVQWGHFTFPGVSQISLTKAEEITVDENLGIS